MTYELYLERSTHEVLWSGMADSILKIRWVKVSQWEVRGLDLFEEYFVQRINLKTKASWCKCCRSPIRSGHGPGLMVFFFQIRKTRRPDPDQASSTPVERTVNQTLKVYCTIQKWTASFKVVFRAPLRIFRRPALLITLLCFILLKSTFRWRCTKASKCVVEDQS